VTSHTPAANVERLAALTFDLDSLARDLYRQPLSPGEIRRLEDVSFERVVPRIGEWLDKVDVRATFFTIGEYAQRYPTAIRQLAGAGHEIASHTQTHPRHFSTLGANDVRRELSLAHETLASAAGKAPRGFRAPGFTTSPVLIESLIDLGYAYDSSVVPSWTYTSLKHAYRLAGAASAYPLFPESYGCTRAPQMPYRISPLERFGSQGQSPLLEIPISTGSLFQWPLIYGLHFRAPDPIRQWMERSALSRPFVLMVFHDLEFATEEDLKGLPVGSLTAPHARKPLNARLSGIERWIADTRRTHRFAPLRDVADRYSPECVSIAV
jgi:hypothetical protein